MNAFSYKGGYAIGYYGNAGSSITITGGTVTATAGYGSYGIGGKASGAADISISGGNVTANGDAMFPAIGGQGGKLDISGGTVVAWNKNSGPGIAVYSGETNISGGTVYAACGDPTTFLDIGGMPTSLGTLAVSGTAKVFLKNNSCITPVTTTHENETFSAGTTEAYGVSISPPDTWTGGFGAWLPLCELTYGANGASGTAPAGEKWIVGKTINLQGSSGLLRSGYIFSGWNTAADGSGTGYAAGSSFTFNTDATLYAQWTELTLASTAPGGGTSSATVYTGGRFTLTPSVSGGTWSWDEEYFSATFNSPATFTALKVGNSTITYTVGGQTTSYVVTIRKSGLPDTGQDYIWIYILCGLGILAAAGAFLYRKYAAKVN